MCSACFSYVGKESGHGNKDSLRGYVTYRVLGRHTANVGPGPVGPSFSVPAVHLGVPLALAGRLGEGGAVGTLDALRAPPVLTQDEVTTADRVRDLAVLTTQRVFLAWSQRERRTVQAAYNMLLCVIGREL